MIARRYLTLATILLLTLLSDAKCLAVEPAPPRTPNAHAHNDYLHPRPLMDALEQGFGSIEADVFLVDGQLLVAHTESELSAQRTLKDLYLKPLQELVKQRGGNIFADAQPLLLLIDFKSDARSTYAALEQELAEFSGMLVRYEGDVRHEGAVEIVISGDRPIKQIMAQPRRLVALDGRLSDLVPPLPHASRMPLISDRWTAHFRWRGEGPLPPEEAQRLQEILDKAHANGQRVRFWATPDHPEAWSILRTAGADLINTDDLAGLAAFLKKTPQ